MVRVTCYMDDCIHQMDSHCGVKGGNITIMGRHQKRRGNKKASCCDDYQEA